MNELKPCPFCGCDLEYAGDAYKHPINDCFLANVDDVCGYVTVYGYEQEKWNRRAESKEMRFTREFIHEHGLDFALASAWKGRTEDGK